ncbi:MAG: hypothetical protein HYZ36_02485, partial [Pedosphaera parvula]|nr:hypothetical protein [Pedosphaera parvula]
MNAREAENTDLKLTVSDRQAKLAKCCWRPGMAITLLVTVVALAEEPAGRPSASKTGEGSTMTATGAKAQGIMAAVGRIVFAGDSLTDGSAWCDWVIETLRANGYPNLIKQDAGVAGDDVPRLKARFQHDVLDLKPDLVILNIGTNDREPVEDYRRNVEEMVKQLLQ